MPNFYVVVPSVAFEYDKSLTRKIMRQAGNEIRLIAQSLIGRSASGRIYGRHTASAPGQPPASLLGDLARSLVVSATGDSVRIRDIDIAAKFLETGAIGGGGGKKSRTTGKKRGSKGTPQTKRIMLPRPFLSIAAQMEMGRLPERINNALSQSIDLKVLRKT